MNTINTGYLSYESIIIIVSLFAFPHRSLGFVRVAVAGRNRCPATSIQRVMSSAAKALPENSSDITAADVHNNTPPVQKKAPPEPRKSHCTTVCAVPPPSATEAWEALTRARRELRDPGFYRWPPHANLLYPFLKLNSMKKRTSSDKSEIDEITEQQQKEEPLFKQDMLDALSNVAAQCEPFDVTISELGMFGGKSRGILWAYPRSSRYIGVDDRAGKTDAKEQSQQQELCNSSEPMIQLQALLEKAFPTCTEQRKQRQFHPHITLSHYASLDDASKAKKQIEEWWTPIHYRTSEIYVLQRVGDGGQFEIAATVPLGLQTDASVEVHDPPIPFIGQPKVEEDWVYQERMALKARRNNNGSPRNRRRAGRQRRNGREPRTPDTPEVIAAKRAARKAKREALEREALAQEASEQN